MFHTAFELFWQSGLYMQSARAHVHSLCNSYMGNDFSCSELPFKNLKWNIVVQYLSTIWNYTLKHSSSVIGCWTAVWGTLDRSWTGTSMLKQTAVWILFTSVPFSSLPPFFFYKKLTHWNECACCHEQTLGHSVAFSSAVPYAHTAARWGQLGLRHNGSYCSTTHCVIDLFTVHWLTECVASSVFHSIFVWTDAVPVENAFVFLLLEVHYNDSVTFIKLEAWTETDLKKSLSEPAEVEMSRHIERLFTTYPTVKIW